jgi:hypothetical protein
MEKIRICCEVTPTLFRAIDRLAKQSGTSHQTMLAELVTAEVNYRIKAERQNDVSATLFNCSRQLEFFKNDLCRLIQDIEQLKP